MHQLFRNMAILIGGLATGCTPSLPTKAERLLEEYRTEAKYQDFKAMAFDSETGAWGRVWAHITPEKAIVGAMERCQRQGRNCKLYALGDTRVWGMSQEDLDRVVAAYYRSAPSTPQKVSCQNFAIQTTDYIRHPVTGDCIYSTRGQDASLVEWHTRFFRGDIGDTGWYMNVSLRSAVGHERFHYVPVRKLLVNWRVAASYGTNFGEPDRHVIAGRTFDAVRFEHQEHVNRHYCVGFSAYFDQVPDGTGYKRHLNGYICSLPWKKEDEFYLTRIENVTVENQ